MLNQKKYQKFQFIQHNIKKIELYNKELPENKGKIIDKRSTYRDLKSYLDNSGHKGIDLFTLQEVQNSSKENSGILYNTEYTFIYNPTGEEEYYYKKDNNSISEDIVEKEHGCMVVFNNKRFKAKKIFKLNEYKELKKCASHLVHLEDIISNENYLVLSLQGYEPKPMNIKKIKKLNESLSKMITDYDKKLKEEGTKYINFIIGTDMKYNIFKPKILKKKISSTKKSKTNKKDSFSSLKKSIINLINKFNRLDIDYDLDENINTIYKGEKNSTYQDCNDFVFKSKFLKTYEIEYGCNHIGTIPSIKNKLLENRDDFEHKYIYCLIGLNEEYE